MRKSAEKKESGLSPMMKHYLAMKEQYPGTVMMYRLGDFYEMFFDDAVEVSKLLDLTLTGRDCGLEQRAPMCGVPFHAVDGYIAKLVKLGKKVAICEQLTAPGDQKGMVERDVVRVITPGTVTDETMLESGVNNYLASVVVKGDLAAVAWADVSTGEVKVLETPASRLEDQLLSIAPCEIIASESGAAYGNALESVELGKLCKFQGYYDYAFHADNAESVLREFYGVYHLSALGLESGEAVVSALGALIDYIQSTQKRTLKHILPPRKIRPESGMYLDYTTKKNLELTETIADKQKIGSLLWVLDRTETNMGARLLRRYIQEPSRDEPEINLRLDAVEELYRNSEMRSACGLALHCIRDIERLCNKIAYNTVRPNECIAIKESLVQIPPLVAALGAVKKSDKLLSVRSGLDPLPEVAACLEAAIQPQGDPKFADRIIKDGYNEELDAYREAHKSARKLIAEFEGKERQATGIKNLKVAYNRVFGYYIEVSKSNLPQVPYYYERKQTLVGSERFMTPELKELEEVILTSQEKAQKLEERLYAEIKRLMFDILPVLQKNAALIGELDVLYSFAEVAVRNGYKRPVVSARSKAIVIKEGRHPVVEALKRKNTFVANDAVLDAQCRTVVVTGPNMAGKSTYMRQVAVIVLMAHLGSFVPAERAEIGIVDRIFTRVGASDNLAFGQSTFMVEMSEVANILNNATEDSLLVLDEIGRGTSTLDGLSIAWAIVEHIALKLKAKTLFATHYHELTELENLLPALKNYHILIKENKDGITFLYKIARGGASKSFGLEVAKLAGVNVKVIDRAKEIMGAIESTQTADLNATISAVPSADATPTNQIGFFAEDSRYEALASVIRDIDVDSCTPLQALTILTNLKQTVTAKPDAKSSKKR